EGSGPGARRRSRGQPAAATSTAPSAPPVRPSRLRLWSSTTSTRRVRPSTPPRPRCVAPAQPGSSLSRSRERAADGRLQVGRHLLDALLDRPRDAEEADAARDEVVELLPLEGARQLALELARPVLDPAELVAAERPGVVRHRAVDELVQARVGTAVRSERPLERRP